LDTQASLRVSGAPARRSGSCTAQPRKQVKSCVCRRLTAKTMAQQQAEVICRRRGRCKLGRCGRHQKLPSRSSRRSQLGMTTSPRLKAQKRAEDHKLQVLLSSGLRIYYNLTQRGDSHVGQSVLLRPSSATPSLGRQQHRKQGNRYSPGYVYYLNTQAAARISFKSDLCV
jgi:hypothetical protein